MRIWMDGQAYGAMVGWRAGFPDGGLKSEWVKKLMIVVNLARLSGLQYL